jgi:LuxR family maltose regulon positive regulatory protein
MAGISIRASDRRSDFIQRFKGRQRDIANYLLEEVIGRQTERMCSFLLQTSVLGRMNDSLCRAVTDFGDSRDLLKQLESKQMFVIPLDDHGEWYRYHHLFSDFLQQQLRANDPEQWGQAHLRAAKWFEAQGTIEEAVEHYLAGQHYEEMIQVVESMTPLLMQLNRSVLYRWMTLLPESLIAENPKVEIFYFSVLNMNGDSHLAKSRFLKFQDKLSEEKWRPYAGIVYLALAAFAIYEKDASECSSYLEQFNHVVPDGIAYQMIGGNTAKGTDNDHFLSHLNDFQEAEAFMIRWIAVWENKINYPFIGYFYASYCEMLYERNLLDEAKSFAERALERPDIRPYARITVRVSIILSQIELAEGRTDRALARIENAIRMIDSPDQEVFALKLEAHLVSSESVFATTGDFVGRMQTCGLQPGDAVSLYRIPEYIALARVLEQDNQPDQAELLLDKLYRLSHKENRHRDKIKVLVKWSMLYDRLGNKEAAIEKLSAALQTAEPNGYVRSFVDEGTGMARLLERYLQMRQQHFMKESKPASLLYIKKLLNVLHHTTDGSIAPSSMLTDQQLHILKLIANGLTNKQMAEQCFVTSETIKTHIKHIYNKLDVHNRFHAIQRAKELRLL